MVLDQSLDDEDEEPEEPQVIPDSVEEREAKYQVAEVEFEVLAGFLERKVKGLKTLGDKEGLMALDPVLEGVEKLWQLEMDRQAL